MIRMVREGATIAVQAFDSDGDYNAQATLSVDDNGEYHIYAWYKKNGMESMGNLSPEKWGYDSFNFRGVYGAALAFVALHGSGVDMTNVFNTTSDDRSIQYFGN